MPRTKRKTTEIFSIFGQIEAVIAEIMVSEGKIRKIEPNMIPLSAMFNDDGRQARFAIIMPAEHLMEFETRIQELRA